jgi:hypothetical protein
LTRRRILIWGGIAAAGALVFVLVWFQPQKLFIDRAVEEDAPTMAPSTASEAPTEPGVLAEGSFRSLAHRASGQATVLNTGGQPVLRFEDFSVENGPDLFVYLSTGDADGPGRALGNDFVDLGPLKGNIGDQNYDVPEGTDLEKYKTAVIWCRRFTVAFAAAELRA